MTDIINQASLSDEELEAFAQSQFKLHRLKPQQIAIIKDFLNHHDILAVLPTGSGKSLCYQLPALIKPGLFIVISPLIALMVEQVDRLKNLNIAAECLHSNLNVEQQNQIIQQLSNIKLLYISPERLLTQSFFKIMRNLNISGFAIDEVHCMLHWGADFRPEYDALKHLKKYFPNQPMMALTATATQKQQIAIIEHLQIKPKQHIYSAYKPNIQYQVIATSHIHQKTLEIVQQHPAQNGIIYCATRRRVEFIQKFLQSNGIPALGYHAGMTAEERLEQQNRFVNSENQVMVATLAFGMGVDKQDIRYIIHADLPGRLDQLIQETGRAGRDGQTASSYLLYHPEQFLQLNLWRFQKASPLLHAEMVEDLQKMSIFLNSQQCFRGLIAEHFEGEVLPACGECERCVNPKHPPNFATDDVLKLLSTIYRAQSTGTWDCVVDILLGVHNTKTSAYLNLSTYGIGQHLTKFEWYICLNYLFAMQWIHLMPQTHPTWQLSLQGIKILKSQIIELAL